MSTMHPLIPEDLNKERWGIRRLARRLRTELSPEEVQDRSRLLIEKLEMLPALSEAEIVMGFMAFDNEVDILSFLKKLHAKGRTVLLPRINSEDQLEAVAYQEGMQWQTSRFGIREPGGEAYPIEKIQSVIVPGLAFDPRGYRLGFGKGYYDRLLARLAPAVFRCGICYEFQVVDNVFPHDKDIPMHWIVTDRSEILVDGSFF